MPDLRSLFETPQKARLTIICFLVALATLGAVIMYAVFSLRPGADDPPAQSEAVSEAPSGSPGPDASAAPSEAAAPSQTVVGIVPALTIDQARELALADAGVAEAEADVTREALTQDNGIWVYEFRFRTEKAQYEYLLNANTGEVRGMVKEAFAYPSPEVSAPPASVPPVQSAPPSAPIPTVPPAADVGIEGAKTAALADAGVDAAQAVFTKAEPDYEDGELVYDVEFHTSTHEYEYEIVAATGAVYSRSTEAFQTALPSAGPAQGSASTYIGMDRAKAAALDHAGLSADQVRFTHARMDREDGVMVYEVEFRQGATEYEYKIDAATGRILDHEMDVD